MLREDFADLTDEQLLEHVQQAAGNSELEIVEEDGAFAAWMSIQTPPRDLGNGRRTTGSFQTISGHGTSWREAMEFLVNALADELE